MYINASFGTKQKVNAGGTDAKNSGEERSVHGFFFERHGGVPAGVQGKIGEHISIDFGFSLS
jgi:hypothetical protein